MLYDVFDEFEKKLQDGWQFLVNGEPTQDINKIIEIIQNEKVMISFYPELKVMEITLMN